MGLAGKFQQKRKVIEIAETEIIRCYEDVCQSLKDWVAPAPRVKTKHTENEAGAAQEEIRIGKQKDKPFESSRYFAPD